jgi:heme/copper-type cytochrome/quinol oxidase subunit 2
MGSEAQEVIQAVVEQTHSELILFFVLIVVVLVVFILPLYVMIMKDRRDRRTTEESRAKTQADADNTRQDKYIDREKHIISVITANTEVISGLKTTLEIIRTDTTDSFRRIHLRLDEIIRNDSEHGTILARV